MGESLRSGKKDLLVADRGKLQDHEVREQIKGISVRFQTLKVKEYADEHIYAM